MALSIMAVNESRAENLQKYILAFGDSLMAGYNLEPQKSFPAQLEEKLKQDGYDIIVINASVSGDTTSGGLTRLTWTLDQQNPDFVILGLGANDMLRGIDPKVTEENLAKMLDILKERKIPVLLAGMKGFPNLGNLIYDSFLKMYKNLAEKYDAVYYPFFLEAAFQKQGMMLEDGLHPSEPGVAAIVEDIYPSVKNLIGEK
jgi:acyl-CoA thioesterase-1